MAQTSSDPTLKGTVLIVTGQGEEPAEGALFRRSWQAMEVRNERDTGFDRGEIVERIVIERFLPRGAFRVSTASGVGKDQPLFAKTLTHEIHALKSWQAVKAFLMQHYGVDEIRDFVVKARRMADAARAVKRAQEAK